MNNAAAFENAKLLLDSAKGHIDDLGVAINRFCSGDAWTIVVEPTPENTAYVHKFRAVATSDPSAKVLIHDAANKLKDTLDHVVAECARLNRGHRAQAIKGVSFPFEGTAEKLDDRFDRKSMQAVPEEIRTYLRSLDTYRGGNDRLHMLSALSGTYKHWDLIPVMADLKAVKIIPADGPQKLIQTDDWPAGPGDELVLFTGPKPDIDYHVSLALTVQIQGHPVLNGCAPVPTLRHLADVADNVIEKCEGICEQLGLIASSE